MHGRRINVYAQKRKTPPVQSIRIALRHRVIRVLQLRRGGKITELWMRWEFFLGRRPPNPAQPKLPCLSPPRSSGHSGNSGISDWVIRVIESSGNKKYYPKFISQNVPQNSGSSTGVIPITRFSMS